MEDIKGTIQISDKKITLETNDGGKEVWIRKLNPEFEKGVEFIRFRSQYFFRR
jgi:hypothetical protein